MFHLRLPAAGREVFTFAKRKSECGNKTAEMHSLPRLYGVSQPMTHKSVGYGLSFFVVQSFKCQPIKCENPRNSHFSRLINRTFQPKSTKAVVFLYFSFLRFLTAQNCHKLTNKI